jgi:putative transposase
MCRVLGVAPSGYSEWLQQPLSDRAKEDARLLRPIRASFTASHGTYGAPRVFLDLREAGETFYNRTRRHGHLGGLSPEHFEAAHAARSRGLH